VIKVIRQQCEALEYIDNFLKKESAEERQKRSEAGNKHEEISLVTPEEMGRKYG
jgi:hypothetical protein